MKVALRLLFLVCLLFSLSTAAFSDCLDNGPLGLDIIENKIVFQGEVADTPLFGEYRETMADLESVEFIQSEIVLLGVNNIEAGYGSQNRVYNFIQETGLDTTIRIRLPPAVLFNISMKNNYSAAG
jgi:hypothetical protein